VTAFDYIVMSSYAVLIVTIGIPALKWKTLKKYEDIKEKRDIWLDTDRRNYDLNLENLRRTESDIEFFKDKLSEHKEDSPENKRIKDVIKHLKDRRLGLDTLKNIDSQISIFARKRGDLCASRIKDKEIQDFIHAQEDYHPKELVPGETRLQVPTSWIMTKNIFNPEEIRYMISKFEEEDYMSRLSQHERNDLETIRKQLKKYDAIKEKSGLRNKLTALQVQLPFLNRAWNRSGKEIKLEMMLMIKEDGTSGQIFALQRRRTKIVDRLRAIEWLTDDQNDVMPISDSEILDADTRHAISKNESDELTKIDRHNKKLNRISFVIIGTITLVAAFFVKYLF